MNALSSNLMIMVSYICVCHSFAGAEGKVEFEMNEMTILYR